MKQLISAALATILASGAANAQTMPEKAYRIETVEIERGEMDCMIFGDGPKSMVIFPGLSLKSVLISSEVIERAYRHKIQGYTVYLLDRLKDMPDGYTLEMMGEDSAEAMEKLGLKSVSAIGYSQGGMILMHLMIHHPELIGRALLGSTAARPSAISKRTTARWISIAEKGNAEALVTDMFKTIYSAPFFKKNETAVKAIARMVSPNDLRRFIIGTSACTSFNLYDELDRVKCPVLVIGSNNDNTLGGASSREIAERLGCELYMYDGYGHSVYDEAPDYKDRMFRFFNEELPTCSDNR